ncbi:54S ribosomal protein L24, mitochondrial [Psilocybe cubensis]|uniref:54S ribosomal protein L24, mitochondrial n=2 Tax=Psilocybe cubensis TaxID=181762 RepID=A0ACB8GH77_PSICU|nr:54S ribosomal protein L24, mitochondrial [Psilocybe cubensis]KAH9474410.1 54S ribosomal protein L24, mitochondrial [Psilocybe cubensis]
MFPSKALWDVVSQPFKRSQNGLFHGKMKQYGNNVPFSKHKTRRSWLPNVQQKRIYSEILGENVRMKLTTRALKTIKTKGGLDKYLNTTPADTLGHMGMKLRLKVRAKRLEDKGRPEPRFELLTPAEEEARKPLVVRLPPKLNPALEKARMARELAGQSLGKDGPATARETIKYLIQVSEKRRAAMMAA